MAYSQGFRLGHTKSDEGPIRTSPDTESRKAQHKSLDADISSPAKGRISGASSSWHYPNEDAYRQKILKLEEQLRRAILAHDKASQEKQKSERHRQSLLYQLDPLDSLCWCCTRSVLTTVTRQNRFWSPFLVTGTSLKGLFGCLAG